MTTPAMTRLSAKAFTRMSPMQAGSLESPDTLHLHLSPSGHTPFHPMGVNHLHVTDWLPSLGDHGTSTEEDIDPQPGDPPFSTPEARRPKNSPAVQYESMDLLAAAIKVNAPPAMAYEEWSWFDEVPHFMMGVDASLRPQGNRPVWRIDFGGQRLVWDGEVCEQIPNHRISWRNADHRPCPNSGSVRFSPIGKDMTRVIVELEFVMPRSPTNLSDSLRKLSSRVEQGLTRFRDRIDARIGRMLMSA